MKIRSVTAHPMRYPEPHDHNRMRHVLLVRVEAEDGTTGWGEGITMWPEATLATKTIVEGGLAALLIGEEVRVERLYQKMSRHLWWYGPQGIAAFALSALDIALWDLKGKLEQLPVHALLGGKINDRVLPMGCVHFDMDDLEWNHREFGAYVEMGYRVVKGGWGSRPENVWGTDLPRDVGFIAEVRQRIGNDVGLVVDALAARTGWNLKTAQRYLQELEPFGLRWVEEPLHPLDLEGHRALRASSRVEIGTGEQEWHVEGYRRLLRFGDADVIQMDPARCHGISGCRHVIRLLEAERRRFSLHTWSSAVCVAAGVHLLATSQAADSMDFKPRWAPITHELVERPIEAREGWIEVGDDPGLGITVCEDAVAKFRFS